MYAASRIESEKRGVLNRNFRAKNKRHDKLFTMEVVCMIRIVLWLPAFLIINCSVIQNDDMPFAFPYVLTSGVTGRIPGDAKVYSPDKKYYLMEIPPIDEGRFGVFDASSANE